MTSQTVSRPARRARFSRPVMILAGLLAIGLLVVGVRACMPKKAVDPYRTASVERGDLTRSVSASGTVQALVTVQVGSQVSGLVKEVFVDFNSPVKKGQTLAIIDQQTFQSAVRQAQADVGASAATLDQQKAALLQAKAQAQVDLANYNRTKYLADKGIASPQALDGAVATYKRSEAGVAVAQAQIGAQQARVGQAAASLQSMQVNLARTKILSPIDGVVVNRAIDPGQTVQASFQAPVLFQIAQDLSKLQVKIMVDEADIGQLQEGQAVNFTVDSFPDRTFQGVVTQVRKQPETQQNVVAYAVMVRADNPGGILLPGMTANADIVIQRLTNVVKVPVAALRFTPGDQQPTQQVGGQGFAPGLGGPPGGFAQRSGGGGGTAARGARSGQGGGVGGMQRMLTQLDLSDDQKAKADAIFADMRTKIAAAGDDRGARRKATEEAYGKLDGVLKPDQKLRLQVLRVRQGGGGGTGPNGIVWVLRKDKAKPEAVPVRTGVSDGSFTEITGPLQPGDQVIIGGGPKPKTQVRGGPLGTPASGTANRTRF